MLVGQVLNDYLKKYPIYNSIKFSIDNKNEPEHLHPLLIVTQYIIDKLISDGNKRIAIVLPDNECSILPLIIAKYFSNILNESDYAGSVLEDIEEGQHISLGKAVVEFLGIDENENRIKFRTDRKNPTIESCPINGIHYLFEKTKRAISSHKVWTEARKEAEDKLSKADELIAQLKVKRTTLKKTIALLAAKNDFKDFIDNLIINEQKFGDVAAYGEIDLDQSGKFTLFNKGRLDCIPSIAVTSKIEEIYYLLKDPFIKDSMFAIFSTIDKFDEIINNSDTLKKILKHDIPFVAFIPESGFENYQILNDFGFELWHWKPSTMKSEAFLVPRQPNIDKKYNSLFVKFTEKVNRATLSNFKMEVSNDCNLKKTVGLINLLSQKVCNADNILRQLVRKIWAFQNKLSGLICEISGEIKKQLEAEFLALKECWALQCKYYKGQEIATIIENVFDQFKFFLSGEKNKKLLKLEQLLMESNTANKLVTVLVPNRYQYYDETAKYINAINEDCNIQLRTLSEFFTEQNDSLKAVDYLIVTWFDKDEYIRIKQTYCYENLVFVLYDYENKWRERYINKIDECIPHEIIMRMADKMCFSQEEIFDKPFDRIVGDDIEEFEEISDYNISHNIIRYTLGPSNTNQTSADSIECIPVILSDDKIAYFYPTHDVIDVTALSKGDIDRPIKKNAVKLRKGDKILIRQSDRDIIRETADKLMLIDKQFDLREQTEIWSTLLGFYANNKSVTDVCNSLNYAGGECTEQQIRYWLSGETIMPREKGILIAIGIVASRNSELKEISDKYLDTIDLIYDAGRKVQSYHQKAGRWLTSELKNKAGEIKTISNSNIPCGNIGDIGEIHIYTVEDVLDKEIVGRGKINKIEDLY